MSVAAAGVGISSVERTGGPDGPVRGAGPDSAGPVGSRRLTPYFLLLPALLALVVFYVLPTLTLASTSLQTGDLQQGYSITWHWATYGDVLTQYWPQFLRSFAYAAAATLFALLIAYPLAYTIARRAGRWRNVLLALVVAPFFTSFLIRTLAWRQILADQGWVVSIMKSTGLMSVTDWLGLTSGRLLATPVAVVLGLTYNFLPFMTLPLYTSLEKIDPALLQASGDLYANAWQGFWRVTWPLSLPGVVGGTLLTFIPAAGDFVNQQFLGSVSETMTGNVIDSLALTQRDYPSAAAMSLVLMVAIVVLVTVYVRRSGTDELV
ncbi:ABC transporter permease [Nakamurella endophytica]|uniref:ABC transporter permease n=1 Tax=Nakamurella endophytica TaxID=1748367 RepID=A0A917TAL6_9ACTN|nr:ABC transporter permease [Nakamurella endophytica]GGM16468.1 ABC transporter permease [Nakamurella endophytica]